MVVIFSHAETLHAETLHAETLHAETLHAETLHAETLHATSLHGFAACMPCNTIPGDHLHEVVAYCFIHRNAS
jgi:hypothetical protein